MIKPTFTLWLPTLSNIPPPYLRRKNALLRDWNKLKWESTHPSWPFRCLTQMRIWLIKKTPQWLKLLKWMKLTLTCLPWNESAPPLYKNLPCIDVQPPVFDTRCKLWVTLNLIWANCGRCVFALHQWGKLELAACDCGAKHQTIQHIVAECPIQNYSGSFNDFLYTTNTLKYNKDFSCNEL